MATTTNYGWTTPDDTSLVKDGAAAIRTLGSSVDTTTKALNPSTTLGDLEYRSATANTNTRLAIGTTGQILTVTGGVPVWAAPAGGGKVLQVVQATTTTETTVASTSFTDTALSLSITPSSATSKVLIIVNQAYSFTRNNFNIGHGLNIVRNSTEVFSQATQSAGGGLFLTTLSSPIAMTMSGTTPMTYLDSPATTSAITYKTQGRVNSTGDSGVVYYQASSSRSVITLLEIGA